MHRAGADVAAATRGGQGKCAKDEPFALLRALGRWQEDAHHGAPSRGLYCPCEAPLCPIGSTGSMWCYQAILFWSSCVCSSSIFALPPAVALVFVIVSQF